MQWCYCIFSFLGKRGPGTTGNSYTLNFSLRLFFQRHHLCQFLDSESRERALVTGKLWPNSTGGITLGKTIREKSSFLRMLTQRSDQGHLFDDLAPRETLPSPELSTLLWSLLCVRNPGHTDVATYVPSPVSPTFPEWLSEPIIRGIIWLRQENRCL